MNQNEKKYKLQLFIDASMSIVSGFSIIYAYCIWATERSIKYSNNGMKQIVRIQATIIPVMPFLCYFLALVLMAENIMHKSFSPELFYGLAGLFLTFVLFANWKWLEDPDIEGQYKKFESINLGNRRFYDLAYLVFFLLAIPVVLWAAMKSRSSSIG